VLTSAFPSSPLLCTVTFGTGGKNAQGEHVPGFGVYETCAPLLPLFGCTQIDSVILAQHRRRKRSGTYMERNKRRPRRNDQYSCATTLSSPPATPNQTHPFPLDCRSRIPKFSSDGTRRFCTNSPFERVLEVRDSTTAATGSSGCASSLPSASLRRLFDPFLSSQEIEFTEKTIQVSILSERRTYAPWGLEGGGDAQCGRNRWFKLPRKDDGDLRTASKDEHGQYKHRVINLGGKATVKMGKGDRIMIETPGGGAWGKEGEEKRTEENDGRHERGAPRGSHYERLAAQEGV
jgi:hypothetical protein